jgi:aerobic-type carbon monoxide dehydrogenase small subunit (CoxS/CutS family)
MSGRVAFVCDGASVEVDAAPGETLLSVLRERLGITGVKDGCAPQGQCGCCTVLVDGDARVACVTPVERIAGRTVTTVDGLPAGERAAIADAFVATGGSQCGFCTPGIVVRAAALRAKGRITPVTVDRALAAHLCRCTGWRTVVDAIGAVGVPPSGGGTRSLDAAAQRAALEGGTGQRVGPEIALGRGGFADDTAPPGALVAVPLPPGSTAPSVEAAGVQWVVAESLLEARERAGKVQGRRTTIDPVPPLALPPLPDGGVRLATSWVEPGYLEPDASWCAPGGEPATPLANGGAFGGKQATPVITAARELADRFGRTVRTLFAREDMVRLGEKPGPFAASAVLRDSTLVIDGVAAGAKVGSVWLVPHYRGLDGAGLLTPRTVAGPPVSGPGRQSLTAGIRVLHEGALEEAGFDRAAHLFEERSADVFLDNVMSVPDAGSRAGARVVIDDETGAIERVEVRVAAGDPLDEVVLRSYAIGATHMALGWVFTEGLAVDPDTGEVHDLTIRSFGIIPARNTPPIDVTIVDDPGPPLARASDAVFAAVAASAWNAVTRAEGVRPETFPALHTRTARMLRA